MNSLLYSIGGGKVYRAETQFSIGVDATVVLVNSNTVTGKILYPATVEINCVKGNGTNTTQISMKWSGGTNFIRNARIDDVYDSLFFEFPTIPWADAKAEAGVDVVHSDIGLGASTTCWVTMNYYLVDA
jgi:hypothetical protein